MSENKPRSIRGEYGKTLVELGKTNNNIVVIDADLSCSTQTKMFANEYPERFFNVGIAEQDAITTAAGLATVGKTPFVSTFAMFASGRAWEQVRNSVAYACLNVKIVATHGGITVGEDGASHQALEDLSLMRSIPGMMVIIPADAKETREVIKYIADYNGPVYVRLSRSNLPDVFPADYSFNPNKAKIVQEGTDVTLISNGDTLNEVISCAKILKERNIMAEILHIPVIKPFDKETVIKSAQKTSKIVTIENHSIIGGLGSTVCETLSEGYPVKVLRIGTNDEFGQSGNAQELMEHYGLTANKLADKIIGFIK